MSVLAVRLDSLGDALVTSPAFRALATRDGGIDVLCGPAALPAMPYLPGVRRAAAWRCPWIDASAPMVMDAAVAGVRAFASAVDEAVIFTSFHQSALPTALILRLAGVRRIGAYSDDFPGSLLDVRAKDPGNVPEPVRAVALARACGFADAGDRLHLTPEAIAAPLPFPVDPDALVVVHPGASASARRWPVERMTALVAALTAAGFHVVVTGGAHERELCRIVAGDTGHSAAGTLGFAELASLLHRARCLVAGNTGPAHVAAAVGTPVVCLFSPIVPAERWAPYGVTTVLLGDQNAACAGTRMRVCTVPGHPCLSEVPVVEVIAAVTRVSESRPLAAELEEAT